MILKIVMQGVIVVAVNNPLAFSPDFSLLGWAVALRKYKADRAPDEEFSINSHREAGRLFRESIQDGNMPASVYDAAIASIYETMHLTWQYCTTKQNDEVER